MQPIDLSRSDSSALIRGRSFFIEVLWHYFGTRVVQTDLLPMSWLKVWMLRAFGARVGKGVYIKPSVKVKFPWYLEIGDNSWIGERVWIDNLAPVRVGSNVCISQDAYLCTGNHDWCDPHMRLYARPIDVRDGAWIGARVSVFGGVTFEVCAIAVGGSVVMRNVPSYEIHGGNPARYLKIRAVRSISDSSAEGEQGE